DGPPIQPEGEPAENVRARLADRQGAVSEWDQVAGGVGHGSRSLGGHDDREQGQDYPGQFGGH
ncbi:hypothetical protein LCGC14_2899160, partial [marine sediment metagenome]